MMSLFEDMYAFVAIYADCCFFFFQAEDGIRDDLVTGVQTCALPIWPAAVARVCSRLPRFLPGYSWLALLADRKSTRLNSSHQIISYAVFCLKKKKDSSRRLLPYCP